MNGFQGLTKMSPRRPKKAARPVAKALREDSMMRIALAVLLISMAAGAADTPSTTVTFNKQVLPILQNNCQSCHRPNQIAPMSFLTYQEVRPYAAAIKIALLTKKMPPWFADPAYGHFSNERKLTPEEIRTLVRWVDAGAPEGDAKD